MHTHSILQVNSNIKQDSIYSLRHQIHQLQQQLPGLSQALKLSKAEMTMEDIMWARLASMGPEANVGTNVGTHSVPMMALNMWLKKRNQ